MKPQTIADEIHLTIEEDNFSDLDEKMEAIELLASFECATSAIQCTMCDVVSGRYTCEYSGNDISRCEPCKGVGYIPLD